MHSSNLKIMLWKSGTRNFFRICSTLGHRRKSFAFIVNIFSFELFSWVDICDVWKIIGGELDARKGEIGKKRKILAVENR